MSGSGYHGVHPLYITLKFSVFIHVCVVRFKYCLLIVTKFQEGEIRQRDILGSPSVKPCLL